MKSPVWTVQTKIVRIFPASGVQRETGCCSVISVIKDVEGFHDKNAQDFFLAGFK